VLQHFEICTLCKTRLISHEEQLKKRIEGNKHATDLGGLRKIVVLRRGIAYALGGEDLVAPVVLGPRGLPLPERGVGTFGVADNWGGGGSMAVVLCADGDNVTDEGAGAERSL
jgi:hypothetical protein